MSEEQTVSVEVDVDVFCVMNSRAYMFSCITKQLEAETALLLWCT